MNLSEIISLSYPDANRLTDIVVQDDGNGQYIQYWNEDKYGPKPEEQDIMATEGEYLLLQLQHQLEEQLRQLIDSKPGEKGYDNILTLASYTTSGNAQWKAEADAFIAWRDSLFAYAYQVLADVQQGNQAAPTIQEFLDGAPALVWP